MNYQTVNPFNLPCVEFQHRNNLPTTPLIYFVISGDEVVYVGQSINGRNRWSGANHHRSTQIKLLESAKISFLQVGNAFNLNVAETFFIEKFKPRLNGTVKDNEIKTVDKFRLRKHLQPRVQQWSETLEISQSRLIEDAITFYLKHLENESTIEDYI